MSSNPSPSPPQPAEPGCLSQVMRHRNFRGVTVICDLLSQFTMYTIDLEEIGLFISDSRPEAFRMAFAALQPG